MKTLIQVGVFDSYPVFYDRITKYIICKQQKYLARDVSSAFRESKKGKIFIKNTDCNVERLPYNNMVKFGCLEDTIEKVREIRKQIKNI